MAKTAAEKLGIKPEHTIYPVNPPGDYVALIGGLPPGAAVVGEKALPADVVHLFAADGAELARHAKTTIAAVKPGGLLWVSYLKGGASDIKRDTLVQVFVPYGWRGVSLVSVDERWSAMRFRPLPAK